MLLSLLFPELEITLTKYGNTHLLFTVRSHVTSASCPGCGTPSSHLHGSYTRTITDLPISGRQVFLRLRVRRFLCLNPCCGRVTFAERFPELTSPHARRSSRLTQALQQLACTAGGQPTARLTGPLALPGSRNSFLRLIRRSPVPPFSAPTAVGIDDWAWKKGHRYGALVIDLETHRPLALLPDRSADTIAAWLRQYPSIRVVSRDRGKDITAGVTRGAPQATQIADRFHLLSNLRTVIEEILRARVCSYPTPRSSVRAASFLFLPPRPSLTPRRAADLTSLLERNPSLLPLYELTRDFYDLLMQQQADTLANWLPRAFSSPFPRLHTFARGLFLDLDAIRAACSSRYSNGLLEGHVNRLKTLKRSMYGRAAFDLLQARVLFQPVAAPGR